MNNIMSQENIERVEKFMSQWDGVGSVLILDPWDEVTTLACKQLKLMFQADEALNLSNSVLKKEVGALNNKIDNLERDRDAAITVNNKLRKEKAELNNEVSSLRALLKDATRFQDMNSEMFEKPAEARIKELMLLLSNEKNTTQYLDKEVAQLKTDLENYKKELKVARDSNEQLNTVGLAWKHNALDNEIALKFVLREIDKMKEYLYSKLM